ncbi:MAG: CCA tRNA nucleotidyltransferase [Clostridia bacterium]|nr:CCA tRNA nucleotidyltransferase [Clostridia bacterium]
MILPHFITKTVHALESCGFEAFLVGGSVRDSLLGHSPTDWDITTSAEPKDVIRIFGEENCIPTGIKHGTITLLTDNQPVEITTYRIDGNYLDNRHPENIIFSKNILEDLSRRDFTINAIAYNPKSGILDPFNGKSDLNNKIIRTVGKAEKRFSEDALRIMRALRFAATLDFEIEEDTLKAIHSCKGLLQNIARERLQAELSKLLLSPSPQKVLTECLDVFAEIFDVKYSFLLDIWCKNSQSLKNCDAVLPLRLAVLLDGISIKPPHILLRDLKFDNHTLKTVKTLSEHMNLSITPHPVLIKHMLSNVGEDTFKLILKAQLAKSPEEFTTIKNTEAILNNIISTNQCYSLKQLAVCGNDLMAMGITGCDIGKTLNALLYAVIEGKCENKKDSLVEYIIYIQKGL